jgi:hypothetical protein
MNCDEAFDVLTRGPFPSGDVSVDDAVERHLAACHSCRQLAEALRPAIGIFHETMVEAESLSLPGYSGELSPAAAGSLLTLEAPASDSMRTRKIDAQRSGRKSTVRLWPFVAAGLMGLVVGTFGENVRSRQAEGIATAGSQPLVSQPVNREGRLLLASLNLPSACRDTSDDSGQTISSWYQCCTRCHAAAEAASAPAVPLLTLTSSCLVCHSDAYRAEVSWSFPPLQWDTRQAARAAENASRLSHNLGELGEQQLGTLVTTFRRVVSQFGSRVDHAGFPNFAVVSGLNDNMVQLVGVRIGFAADDAFFDPTRDQW